MWGVVQTNVGSYANQCGELNSIEIGKKRTFDGRKQEIKQEKKQVYKTSHKTRARARDYNMFFNFCQYIF